jgi:hypothetical protein
VGQAGNLDRLFFRMNSIATIDVWRSFERVLTETAMPMLNPSPEREAAQKYGIR